MKTLIIYLLFCVSLFAQFSPIIEAPEKWSKPEKIQAIQDLYQYYNRYPSVSWDGKKIFYINSAIFFTELTDSGWTLPQKLPDRVNYMHPKRKVITSPDGKTLLIVAGSTNKIFQSNWNESLNDWDSAKILIGGDINTPPWENWGLSNYLDDTTLIVLRTYDGRISYFNKETQQWGQSVPYPHSSFPIRGVYGSWVSPDRKKWYGARTTRAFGNYDSLDLYVSYYIEEENRYKHNYRLNIFRYSDSLHNAGAIYRKTESSPFLTPDGKTMYFEAFYDSGGYTIYVSHMLIDENGDTVVTKAEENQGSLSPEQFELYPAYPNPFNPVTNISYQLPADSFVSLKVYDILGKEVAALVNEQQKTGRYNVNFNASHLASGVYIYELRTNENIQSKKMLLLR